MDLVLEIFREIEDEDDEEAKAMHRSQRQVVYNWLIHSSPCFWQLYDYMKHHEFFFRYN